MVRVTLAAVGVLTIAAASSLVAETTEVVADRDNTLFQSGDGSLSGGASQHLYSGRVNFDAEGNVERRGIVHFDVSGIPAGASVVSASVRVQVTEVPPAPPTGLLVGLHRCLADWGEGASSSTGGDGASAAAGDATWIHTSYPTGSWANPGGDFDPAASGTTIMNLTGSYTFTGAGLAADVQSWIDGGDNHGWVMVGDISQPRTVRKIASRENSNASHRPTLVVEWEMASNPADLNGDGLVDGADLGLMLAAWGSCSGCDADLNEDGLVNGADLGLLLAAWN